MRLRLSIMILLLTATGTSFAEGFFDKSCTMLSLEKSKNSGDVTLGFSLSNVNESNFRHEDFFVGATERFSANGKPRIIPNFLITSGEIYGRPVYIKIYRDPAINDDDDCIDCGWGYHPKGFTFAESFAATIMDSRSTPEYNFKLDWLKVVFGLGLDYHWI